MTIRLYDTSARQIRDFTPLQPGCVSIYLCGATVQAAPHIGHIRSGLNFDIMRRWFEYRGLSVTFIRNVTDIDDKIIAKSAEQHRPWWSIGYDNERAFTDGYQALGCLPPTYEPRATGHITEMVEMMRGLIERGHAYEADGNVYFAVTSFPGYLKLSNQELDNLLQPSAEGETGKRDPRDFAMWKAAKSGEPSWETPWGRGRPGWHLECSAMAHKYLGSAFDIHGGGLDLIFPHHENEIAQAKAYGDEFARYWVHNAWVTMSGEKMSKSLGNSVLVSEMVKRWRPIVLRYYLGTPHYRSMIEYSEEALREAESAFARIEGFVQRVVEKAGGVVEPAPRCRPRSPRRWTTTWASRRRSPSCTPPSGRATARWPPTTRRRPSPASPRSAPCSVCSASTRWTRTGPARATAATTSTAWSTPSYAWSSTSARPPGSARTGPPRTPSATSSTSPAWSSRTARRDRAGASAPADPSGHDGLGPAEAPGHGA
ncbi:hypothetical protein SHKM778_90070 [Streptomyces sp. KM77-8]|uniref:Cysteine--tRNA ligase n=2 Tax=Streptomyces TaxID=1883 RepID=A0AAT9HZJ6_9ACTN